MDSTKNNNLTCSATHASTHTPHPPATVPLSKIETPKSEAIRILRESAHQFASSQKFLVNRRAFWEVFTDYSIISDGAFLSLPVSTAQKGGEVAA